MNFLLTCQGICNVNLQFIKIYYELTIDFNIEWYCTALHKVNDHFKRMILLMIPILCSIVSVCTELTCILILPHGIILPLNSHSYLEEIEHIECITFYPDVDVFGVLTHLWIAWVASGIVFFQPEKLLFVPLKYTSPGHLLSFLLKSFSYLVFWGYFHWTWIIN